MTLLEHLEELRRRLIICAISLLLAGIVAYNFVDKILAYITKPVGQLVFIQLVEPFVVRLKIAVICGTIISLPVIIYQIWAFISAGLKEDEKRHVFFYGTISLIFFVLGSAFALFFMLPYGIKFLLAFGTDNIRPMISINSYVSFVGMVILAFGIAFEMPVVIMFLTKLGLVTPRLLRNKRKFAIVIIFIVAAILTPPDVFSQIMLALPLLALYELSIWLSYLAVPKKV